MLLFFYDHEQEFVNSENVFFFFFSKGTCFTLVGCFVS